MKSVIPAKAGIHGFPIKTFGNDGCSQLSRHHNLQAAVFFDRDGTLLRERGYLSSHEKLKFYPSVFPAIRKIRMAGLKIVVITNQSGVGRGFFPVSSVRKIHAELRSLVAARGGKIDGIYFCPHLPQAGCACRKPKPGLARRAAQDLGIDLKRSYVVGDQAKDLRLARNIRGKGILVLTGAGSSADKKERALAAKITPNLLTAAKWIIKDLTNG